MINVHTLVDAHLYPSAVASYERWRKGAMRYPPAIPVLTAPARS
jgi:hypothetical protein